MKSLSIQNTQNTLSQNPQQNFQNKGYQDPSDKGKFNSNVLERYLVQTTDAKETKKKEKKEAYKEFNEILDLGADDNNLIIFHRRQSGETIDNFSINEDNFLDKSFIQLMNSVTIGNIHINTTVYSDDELNIRKRNKKFHTVNLFVKF